MFKENESKQVNLFWNTGNVEKLKKYYKGGIKKSQNSTSQNFYADANGDTNRIIHSGLPSSISDTIIDLIGIDNVIIETKDSGNQESIDNWYDTNEILDKFEKMINDITWSGSAYYKFNIFEGQVDLSIVNPLDARIIRDGGKIFEYQFITWECKENNKRTVEVYGKGYIETQQQEKENNKNTNVEDEWKIISTQRVVFNTETIFAGNMTVVKNAYFKSLQIFDALDETTSRMVDEARKGQMVKYISEELLPKDNKNEAQYKEFLKLGTMHSDDAKKAVGYMMADIDPDKRYIKSMNKYEKIAIRNAGLSWHTFAGAETGSGLSAEAQRELEKLSIRTRNKYIKRLKGFLKGIYEKFLILNSDNISNYVVETETEEISMQDFDYEVTVIFNDYITNSLDKRIEIWGSAEAQANFPIEFRIEQIFDGSLNEEKIKELAKQAKMELGISSSEYGADDEEE